MREEGEHSGPPPHSSCARPLAFCRKGSAGTCASAAARSGLGFGVWGLGFSGWDAYTHTHTHMRAHTCTHTHTHIHTQTHISTHTQTYATSEGHDRAVDQAAFYPCLSFQASRLCVCLRACVCACVRACVRAGVRVYVCACVRVRVCVCARACARSPGSGFRVWICGLVFRAYSLGFRVRGLGRRQPSQQRRQFRL